MIATLVALVTATSTFAAVFPLIRAETPSARASAGQAADELPPRRACRRITIIKKPAAGTVTQGCSSSRKRPCVRRRYW
ncbi:MAG: hypothetical protein JNJ54_05215 [Myxococcaceae bacterium]|nr:hypothetical protein [Myxococcaceae bacterium]